MHALHLPMSDSTISCGPGRRGAGQTESLSEDRLARPACRRPIPTLHAIEEVRHARRRIRRLAHLQRGELLSVDERKGVREVDEVLEARVKVRLRPQDLDLVQVRVVDVRVHAEKPLEDRLYGLQKVSGERLAAHREHLRRREDVGSAGRNAQSAKYECILGVVLWSRLFVVQLALHPLHQVEHIVWRAALYGLLDLHPVRPSVLVLGPRTHDGTAIGGAELGESPVDEGYGVEEVDCVHS